MIKPKLKRPVTPSKKVNLPMKKKRTPAPVLLKVANVEDGLSGKGYELFQFRKPLNRKGRELIARERSFDATKLRDALIARNWDVKPSEVEHLIESAIAAAPTQHWLALSNVGWRSSQRRTFALHNRVVGETGRDLKLKPPMWVENLDCQLKKIGSLDEWKTRVATPAQYSTRMMMLMSCVFAAPLLSIVELQSFAVLLFGRSKSGKTTALLAASSIMGIGRESDLPNFNSTDAAILERARSFNDLVFAVNELGLLKGAKKEAYHRIRTLLYSFSEGADTARHSLSAYSTSAKTGKWRGILLPNSEQSFDALARLAGVERDAGEYARCIDVPAESSRSATIYDRRPPSIPVDKFPAWSRKTLIAVREACAKNYGVAIAPYLEHLMKRGNQCESDVRRFMREFEGALGDIGRFDGATAHAAKNCAAIYAGGRIAIEAGILPWQASNLLNAIKTCFLASQKQVNAAENKLAQLKELLKKKLADKTQLPDKDVVEKIHAGYWETAADGRTRYTVSAASMREWYPTRGELRLLLKWLHSKAVLVSGVGAGEPVPDNTEWAVTTPQWKGGLKQKSFRFYDPF